MGSADISPVDKCGRGPRSCVRYYGARAHVSCAPLPTIVSPLILPFVSRKKIEKRSEIMLLLRLTKRSLALRNNVLYIYIYIYMDRDLVSFFCNELEKAESEKLK